MPTRCCNYWCVLTVFLLLRLVLGQEVLSQRPRIQGALTVEQAVALALKHSPLIRAADASWLSARERVRATAAETKLRLAVSWFAGAGAGAPVFPSAEPVIPQSFVTAPGKAFSDLIVAAMYPLHTGGRLESVVAKSRFEERAEDSARLITTLDVALETRSTFRKVQLAQEVVQVAEAYVRAVEERLRVDRERAKVGKIPDFWILRSEAELANAQQSLVNGRKDLEVALTLLKLTMGVHPDSPITVVSDWTTPSVPLSREKLIETALRERPEIRFALFRRRAEEENLKSAQALYKPQVFLMSMAERMDGRGMGNRVDSFFGLVLSLPLIDGGQRRATVREREFMVERAQLEQEQVILKVVSEVDSALKEVMAATRNVETAEKALRSAEEDLRVSSLRYEAGRSILVEYLDSLLAYIRARTNLVVALYEKAVAEDRLARAVGIVCRAANGDGRKDQPLY